MAVERPQPSAGGKRAIDVVSGAAGAESAPNTTPTPARLYPIKRARRQELWQFVMLAANDEFVHLPSEQLMSDHAAHAYCVKCKTRIHFYKGNHSVREHIARFHVEDLNRYREAANAEKPIRRQIINAFTASNSTRTIATADLTMTADQQLHACNLLARWVAHSLRPLSIVGDPGFLKFVNYVTYTGGGQFKMPGRTQTRSDIARIAAEQRASLKAEIQIDCDYFCATTNIWTDRSMRSFMALTIHYLDRNFVSKSWTLEVEHFPESHTGSAISRTLDKMLDSWELDKLQCTMLHRDGASNAVSACERLGVRHMQCVAHALHLVVAGALIARKDDQENAYHEDDGSDQLRDQVREDVEGMLQHVVQLSQQSAMEKMRSIVQLFRSLARYFRRSTKVKHNLDTIQSELGATTLVGVIIDCPTRWSSTWDMLARFRVLQSPLDHFFAFLATSQGKAEFKNVSVPRPKPADWFALKLLLQLLGPFAGVTDMLSGERYPTLAMTFPCLRCVRDALQDTSTFDREVTLVGDAVFVQDTLDILQEVRRTMYRLFCDRFTMVSVDVVWISLLDPRLTDLTHLIAEEIDLARASLLAAAVEIAASQTIRDDVPRSSCRLLSPEPTPASAKARIMFGVFGRRARETPQQVGDCEGEQRARCEDQFAQYLVATKTVEVSQCPLMWWRTYGSSFPTIAVLARKWLSCVATSAPSERAFSTSGNTVTNKRVQLSPDLVRDIVFISENNKM